MTGASRICCGDSSREQAGPRIRSAPHGRPLARAHQNAGECSLDTTTNRREGAIQGGGFRCADEASASQYGERILEQLLTSDEDRSASIWLVDGDRVAAGALGAVERLVGPVEQVG